MPRSKRSPCSMPGCMALTHDTRCKKHRHKSRSESGEQRQKLYKQKAWVSSRRTFLQLNPLCAECLKKGITKLASVVDHIIPHRGYLDLFWDQENWQSLCKPCHDAKTGRGE